ncbi:indolepyruvate ferredoxin oxidoreductase subunit alpha [Pseudorhodoplanes sinuspersici]|uniref:Indolepyruvate ferredoxin oxidoreductase n=1 Tax=Pseudorhodoplanes sinuspersici TaxID=1235591 RepID=A0A1W6ZLL5_9HYPH|nr:indolepyruvate ferredoxin oxidoreductase subunit alpha [Pseudorhodoplanes sinuspersici]ARP97674.1 indolepyruvate ferredoxin oxidoreductase [Pseudorhodoplanes sinuspersici]RKE68611.1 indolepyruvate ferredoxin oxidoreductase alpha subunit [Pseudorhodoplanes sinuspersici]
MAERSFKEEVKQLKLGAGEEFKGEAILAVTKALLQSGVSYVSGYQGAPISHLIDVLNDANEMLQELGVRFESSANEAAAAASLAVSVNYPLRGACTFKAPVGTNVASDALANLSSGGVKGGALIIVGEDYGEGSSIMQERSHAFAMKSQMWLLDPRPNVQTIVDMVEKGFQLSEVSNTAVMLQLRIRACHVYGSFIAKDNKRSEFSRLDALQNPVRDVSRYALPPFTYQHEHEKIEQRWPAAVKFIKDNKINEFFDGEAKDIGIVMQGGMYNGVLRAMEIMGLADVYGNSRIPLYVLNATYPLVDDEFVEFCAGKKAIMVVEEGQPEFIEQAINTMLRRRDIQTRIEGKSVLPMAGEYTGSVLKAGLQKFCIAHRPDLLAPDEPPQTNKSLPAALETLGTNVQGRPPSFCTGCPERPIFSAMKLVQREVGPLHVSADIGCHTFASLQPFNIGQTTMGYGLGGAGASPLSGQGGKRPVAVVGDGGFWHNGLVSSVGHQVFNKTDGVMLIVDNGYAAATGGQDILSSAANVETRSTQHPIEKAVRGVGVEWVKHITRTYDVAKMRDTLREALTTDVKGPKVIIASSECMLNKQRRVKPLLRAAVKRGERVVRERFGVDPDTCTGDHSCIRLSGCPSLTIAPNPDPLRRDPVTKVINSCVGCGNCGEVAHAAILCPSFFRASIIDNPTRWDFFKQRIRDAVIGFFQRRLERKMVSA